jgi:hypothetical protein
MNQLVARERMVPKRSARVSRKAEQLSGIAKDSTLEGVLAEFRSSRARLRDGGFRLSMPGRAAPVFEIRVATKRKTRVSFR